MRPEMNPLDLNNLPEEYLREGKQILEGSSTVHIEASDTTRGGGCRKKKSGGKDECGKVYECRFCSLKFCKSQALGGHMNRHRQERETETLNRARQLVFSNDNLVAQGGPPLGFRDPNLGTVQPIQAMNVHQSGNIGDPSLPFIRSIYPTRMFSSGGSSSTILSPAPPPLPPPNQQYLYPSFPPNYPPHHHMENDYLFNSHRHPNLNYGGGTAESNYTCIGAPLGRGAVRGTTHDLSASSGAGEDRSLQNQEDGVNWGGRGYGGTQHLDSSSINRFHSGF